MLYNVIYGKTMENQRHTIDIKLVSNKNGFKTSKPNYKSYKIFDNNLAPICKSKLLLRLVFTGMCLFGIKQSINV